MLSADTAVLDFNTHHSGGFPENLLETNSASKRVDQWFSYLKGALESPGELVQAQSDRPHPRVSDPQGAGWGPRIWTSNKFPRDADAADPGTTLWEWLTWHRTKEKRWGHLLQPAALPYARWRKEKGPTFTWAAKGQVQYLKTQLDVFKSHGEVVEQQGRMCPCCRRGKEHCSRDGIEKWRTAQRVAATEGPRPLETQAPAQGSATGQF